MKIYVNDKIKNDVSKYLDVEKSMIKIIQLHKKEYEEKLKELFPNADICVSIIESSVILDMEIRFEGLHNYFDKSLEKLIKYALINKLYDISDDILKEKSNEWIVYRTNMNEEVLKN
jgi:hypothetical protein